MIAFEPIEGETWVLTPEGSEIADTGSHEAKVYEAVPAGSKGIEISELQVNEGRLIP